MADGYGAMSPAAPLRFILGIEINSVILDGVEQPVSKGSLVHIPAGVVHGAQGRMRVLVVGIPDIADDDYFEAPPV